MKNARSAKRKMLFLLLNFLLVFVLYRVLLSFEGAVGLAVTVAYLLITAGLAVAYFIVNRGFGKPVTDGDALPPSWSAAEKCAYIEEAARRHEKARGILLWLLPFVVTMMLDVMQLFLLDPILEMLR